MNKRSLSDDQCASPTSYRLPKRQEVAHDAHGDEVLSTGTALRRYDDYTVAWICALPIEMAAARVMLDAQHRDLPACANDSNSYVLGSIMQHDVVIACLPDSNYGLIEAANVASHLQRTFPSIRLSLMVGIGGGVPSKIDVRLGDVVVGTRATQHDLGKVVDPGGRVSGNAHPVRPSRASRAILSNLRSKHELGDVRFPAILQDRLRNNPEYARPSDPDNLFPVTVEHATAGLPCKQSCDLSRLIPRTHRSSNSPMVHFGGIASGSHVMRNARARDEVARELDVICFEMETAGLMDALRCLPIRGICDYADSHKDKSWQRYAAAAAAAYAREFLETAPAVERKSIARVLEGCRDHAGAREAVENRRQKMLELLKFGRIHFRRLNIQNAHDKTCQWFLQHPKYLAWLDTKQLANHRGLLWLRGKPGSGKSTIMKFLHSTARQVRGTFGLTASHFFHARGEELEKSVLGMYRSLLLQILEGYPELQHVLDNPDFVDPSQALASLVVLKGLLRKAISALDHRVFTCFVDALDESDEQQVMDMIEYFEDLVNESVENGILFRVCFSSRHYPFVDIRVGISLTLEQQPQHLQDLSEYVQSRLRLQSQRLVDELCPQIVEKAAGVFLWVVLVVDILNRENRRGPLHIKRAFAEVPSGLSELFKTILKRDSQHIEEFQLSILWILCARRPLQPKQYHEAMWIGLYNKGLEDDEGREIPAEDADGWIERRVLSSSKGLAEITKTRPTVQFIHESVRDFLIKDKGLYELWPDFGLEWESQGHECLKECCDKYLRYFMRHERLAAAQTRAQILGIGAATKKRLLDHKFPLLRYAGDHVLYHAELAACSIAQSTFLSEFSSPDWVMFFKLLDDDEEGICGADIGLLYLLAKRGCSRLIRTHLEARPKEEIHIRGGRYFYPMFAALSCGETDTVAALLGVPSNIKDTLNITKCIYLHSTPSTYKNRTPLSWAAEEGQISLMRHLIHQCPVNEMDNDSMTPLLRALVNGQEEATFLLIQHGADINLGGLGEGNTLLLPSSSSFEKRAKSLLERGADIANINGKHRGLKPWPLYLLKHGFEEIAKFLVEKGADVDAQTNHGDTMLSYASRHGNPSLVTFLIEHGADFDKHAKSRLTAFEHALDRGHVAVARVLIENGAHLNYRDELGRTALESASEVGNKEIIRLLLDNGAEVNPGGSKWSALHVASAEGHQALAELLIKEGAKVDYRDSVGKTSLIVAAQEGKAKVVKVLLANGANVEQKDYMGKTATELASEGGHVATVRLLKHFIESSRGDVELEPDGSS